MTETGLQVKNLSVTYGPVTAVKQVSFTVQPGQIIALLGPSGCGKSSLLRAIAGLEPAATGTISFDGVDVTATPTHRRGFGMMFQDGQLFPTRTLAGNIEYGLTGQGLTPTQRRERVTELIELVGLTGMGERDVSTLSGGQAQRAALARSLAPRPRCLLFDEPLSALDRGLRERMVEAIGQIMRTTHTTGIYVTHDQDEAFALADVIAMMDHGKIVRLATPPQLWQNPGTRAVAEFLGYGPFYGAEDVPHLGVSLTQIGANLTGGDVLALDPHAVEPADGSAVRAAVTGVRAGRGVWDVTAALCGQPVSFTIPMRETEPEVGAQIPVRVHVDKVAVVSASD